MLHSVTVEAFQSHARTELRLGRFTAVVGASSSGKSAVVRALRVLAANGRGTPYVRHGAQAASVEAVLVAAAGDPPAAGRRVRARRGPKVSEYTLALPGQDAQVFTKCGAGVPEEVTAALDFGFDELWLAEQFDRPYLLDATGSSVARVLGELTNASMLHAAVREVRRRASTARRRAEDRAAAVATARAEVLSYADVPARRRHLTAATSAMSQVRTLDARARELRAAVDRTDDTDRYLTDARRSVRPIPTMQIARDLHAQRATLRSVVASVEAADARVRAWPRHSPPDAADLIELGTRRQRLVLALAATRTAAASADRSRAAAQRSEQTATDLAAQFTTELARLGRCPLCGAPQGHENRAPS